MSERMAMLVEAPGHRDPGLDAGRAGRFVGQAAADEPADAPLPELTPAQLAAKLREAMGRYDDRGSIRVVFTDTQDMNWRFDTNQGSPEEQKPILVSFRGRARYESDGSRWRRGVRLDDAELRFDPAAARPMVNRVRRHRAL